MKLSEIKVNKSNPRIIKDEKFKKLIKSLEDFPKMMEFRPIVVNDDGMILGGNMRYRALLDLGYKEVPDNWVKKASDLTDDEKRRFIIVDNLSFGEHDWDALANEWDSEELESWGLDVPVFEVDEEEHESLTNPKKLSDRFIIPPFSVLDTKQGAWQQRKNYWLNLGIRSELGRDASVGGSKMVAGYDKNGDRQTGLVTDSDTSIFDPVLCELAYQWFNVPKGKILDPFAGGSVRGIVAAKLGFEYLGNDLSEKQIIANRNNAVDVLQDAELYPTWNIGDSLQIDTIAKDYRADMIFSCPPYADLEVYSDAKEDISNMPYKQFIEVYNQIIKKACDQLKEDRFAVFVVGDVRDKKGFYQNFVSYTINAFVDCGVLLYNEMILVNSVGSLAIRAGKQFSAGRKVGKQHQNVLVFYKGNPKNIKANYPELDLSYINEEIESE
jgi:hypothetical protein